MKSKNRLLLISLALILLTACGAPNPPPEGTQEDTPDTLPVVETSPPPTKSVPPSPKPTEEQPESPAKERRDLRAPYLVRLEPYFDMYTDGINTFRINGNGTVTCQYAWEAVPPVLDSLEPLPPDNYAITQTPEYERVCELAREHLNSSGRFDFAYKDGDTYYLTAAPPGGGSGESYYYVEDARFISITTGGKFTDYGLTGIAHAVWYDGYFYYVDMVDRVLGTPGIGTIARMDADCANAKTIVHERVYGTFQITGDRIYYTSLADGKAYSVDLSGGGKTPVGDRIVPDRHRVGLEFYGDIIISKYWQHPGYHFGIFVFPSYEAYPAIMDRDGNSLITFPPELCGAGAYKVINWGGADEDYNGSAMVLQSNHDGSYWVYVEGNFNSMFYSTFDYVANEYGK